MIIENEEEYKNLIYVRDNCENKKTDACDDCHFRHYLVSCMKENTENEYYSLYSGYWY